MCHHCRKSINVSLLVPARLLNMPAKGLMLWMWKCHWNLHNF